MGEGVLKQENRIFSLGEGLIGQCAIEKRIVHLTHVPETYIQLKSGLGSASPQSVLIVPIIHNHEVIAIMELASFEKFTSLQLSLLARYSRSIRNYRT